MLVIASLVEAYLAYLFEVEQWLHPGRLTWNLQITHLERKMILQTSMIMFHVNLPGCSCLTKTKHRSMMSKTSDGFLESATIETAHLNGGGR